jgi:hypothetical protein
MMSQDLDRTVDDGNLPPAVRIACCVLAAGIAYMAQNIPMVIVALAVILIEAGMQTRSWATNRRRNEWYARSPVEAHLAEKKGGLQQRFDAMPNTRRYSARRSKRFLS